MAWQTAVLGLQANISSPFAPFPFPSKGPRQGIWPIRQPGYESRSELVRFIAIFGADACPLLSHFLSPAVATVAVATAEAVVHFRFRQAPGYGCTAVPHLIGKMSFTMFNI